MTLKHTLAGLFLLTIFGCNKESYRYDKYLNGKEIIYTGRVSGLAARPGDQRIQLLWLPSSDLSISKYVVKFNNLKDSLILNANGETTKDTIKMIVPGLGEFSQDFTLFTMDASGNRSTGQTFTAVKVYGPLYISSLRNRLFTTSSINATNLTLNFAPNTDTINVNTKVSYQNNNGLRVDRILHRDSVRITLNNWKSGESVFIRSSYIPVRNSIDTFSVSYTDTIKVN